MTLAQHVRNDRLGCSRIHSKRQDLPLRSIAVLRSQKHRVDGAICTKCPVPFQANFFFCVRSRCPTLVSDFVTFAWNSTPFIPSLAATMSRVANFNFLCFGNCFNEFLNTACPISSLVRHPQLLVHSIAVRQSEWSICRYFRSLWEEVPPSCRRSPSVSFG